MFVYKVWVLFYVHAFTRLYHCTWLILTFYPPHSFPPPFPGPLLSQYSPSPFPFPIQNHSSLQSLPSPLFFSPVPLTSSPFSLPISTHMCMNFHSCSPLASTDDRGVMVWVLSLTYSTYHDGLPFLLFSYKWHNLALLYGWIKLHSASIHHLLFTRSAVYGRLGCFHTLAIINNYQHGWEMKVELVLSTRIIVVAETEENLRCEFLQR